jgi:hypothetical protein
MKQLKIKRGSNHLKEAVSLSLVEKEIDIRKSFLS